MPEVVDIPYFLSFAAQSLAASGGKAAPKVTVPENLESFLAQGVVAYGTPASASNYRHFTILFESTKLGMWGNDPAMAELIAGDGRNPGYFLTEVAISGGDVITCSLVNVNLTVAYTYVRVTLVGRARKSV